MKPADGRVEITAQKSHYGFVWNEAFGHLCPNSRAMRLITIVKI
jgi:hypothetical protein